MAKEVKSIKVHPDYESQEINFRQKLGWEFVSTQEIYNKDTHMESSFFSDSITSVTETVHYVKLTFQRDRSMVNPRLLDLEREIDNLNPPDEPHQFGSLALLVGFFIYIIPYVVMKMHNKKQMKLYNEEYDIYKNRLNTLLAEVDALQE